MIEIGDAAVRDAAAIAAVHVAVWRTAYPGILPDHTLSALSPSRLAEHYARVIRRGDAVLVARAGEAVAGFVILSESRSGAPGDGEIEMLYVLDDWRERGIGRALMRAAALLLRRRSCRSLFLWVLADNPSRWFYERLGGRAAMQSTTRVGGRTLFKVAMVWPTLDPLIEDGE